jgi:hypothetical protein
MWATEVPQPPTTLTLVCCLIMERNAKLRGLVMFWLPRVSTSRTLAGLSQREHVHGWRLIGQRGEMERNNHSSALFLRFRWALRRAGAVRRTRHPPVDRLTRSRPAFSAAEHQNPTRKMIATARPKPAPAPRPKEKAAKLGVVAFRTEEGLERLRDLRGSSALRGRWHCSTSAIVQSTAVHEKRDLVPSDETAYGPRGRSGW